jgi:hypothetical protein
VDVKFREGGSAAFRPYVEIPFPKAALMEAIVGPTVDAEKGIATARRLLGRFGFDIQRSRHQNVVLVRENALIGPAAPPAIALGLPVSHQCPKTR